MEKRVSMLLSITLALAVGYLMGSRCPAPYAVAQTQPPSALEKSYIDVAIKNALVIGEYNKRDLAKLDSSKPHDSTTQPLYDLVESYCEGAKSADGTKALAAHALAGFYAVSTNSDASAMQVTQVAAETQWRLSLIQIQQNQRMIELLDQLASKK